jgi:hypothetical protein
MSKAVILSIGWEHYVIPAKAGLAGKLIELLADAVPARKDFSATRGLETFRLQPKRAQISVQLVGTDQLLPPAADDYKDRDAIDLAQLPGAVRLLKAARP